jgi:hypothetical protein
MGDIKQLVIEVSNYELGRKVTHQFPLGAKVVFKVDDDLEQYFVDVVYDLIEKKYRLQVRTLNVALNILPKAANTVTIGNAR